MSIDQVRAEFEAWLYLDQTKYDPVLMSKQEIEIAKLAYQAGRAALQSQDRVDAERYRWLRENWFTMGSTYKDDQIQFYINGPRYSNATEAELDAAIDHARRVEGDGE